MLDHLSMKRSRGKVFFLSCEQRVWALRGVSLSIPAYVSAIWLWFMTIMGSKGQILFWKKKTHEGALSVPYKHLKCLLLVPVCGYKKKRVWRFLIYISLNIRKKKTINSRSRAFTLLPLTSYSDTDVRVVLLLLPKWLPKLEPLSRATNTWGAGARCSTPPHITRRERALNEALTGALVWAVCAAAAAAMRLNR